MSWRTSKCNLVSVEVEFRGPRPTESARAPRSSSSTERRFDTRPTQHSQQYPNTASGHKHMQQINGPLCRTTRQGLPYVCNAQDHYSTLDEIPNNHARNTVLVPADGKRETAVDKSLFAVRLLRFPRQPGFCRAHGTRQVEHGLVTKCARRQHCLLAFVKGNVAVFLATYLKFTSVTKIRFDAPPSSSRPTPLPSARKCIPVPENVRPQ
jgi:hypothetical protein